MGAISLASNLISHARTKHTEVDYYYINEKVLRKDLIVRFSSTIDQLADIFVKGLTTARFSLLKDKFMICGPPISLKGGIRPTDDLDHTSAPTHSR